LSWRSKGIERAFRKIERELPKIDPEKEERLKRVKEDFWFFCSYYLPHYFTAPPAGYHKILVKIINQEKVTEKEVRELKRFIPSKYHNLIRVTEKLEGLVDVEPREHAKSTRMSLAYPLWRVLTGKSKFILLMSASQEMANLFLENLKAELEENERIIEDFGEQKGEKWKTDFITLRNGSAIVSKGAGSSMRGIRHRQFRPDLVIVLLAFQNLTRKSRCWNIPHCLAAAVTIVIIEHLVAFKCLARPDVYFNWRAMRCHCSCWVAMLCGAARQGCCCYQNSRP